MSRSFQAVHQPDSLMSATLRKDDTNSPKVGTVHSITISHITQVGTAPNRWRMLRPAGAGTVAGALIGGPSASGGY